MSYVLFFMKLSNCLSYNYSYGKTVNGCLGYIYPVSFNKKNYEIPPGSEFL